MSKRTADNEVEAQSAPPPPRESASVSLSDVAGNPIGVTVNLKPDLAEVEREQGETDRSLHLRRLSKSIAGWSTFVVDGEKVQFSQARALTILRRFPHFAAQIERAVKS